MLNAISTQLLARLPALRAAMHLTAVSLPELQDRVSALVATLRPRKAAPALPSGVTDLLLAALCGALAQVQLPALKPALEGAALAREPASSALHEMQASPELLRCLVGCFTEAA